MGSYNKEFVKMGWDLHFDPLWLIPFFVFIVLLLIRYIRRYCAYKNQQERQISQTMEVGTAYPAFPTPQSAGGFTQPPGGGFTQSTTGGFTQPSAGDDAPPPYNVAVGYGFDESKYGSGFDSS